MEMLKAARVVAVLVCERLVPNRIQRPGFDGGRRPIGADGSATYKGPE